LSYDLLRFSLCSVDLLLNGNSIQRVVVFDAIAAPHTRPSPPPPQSTPPKLNAAKPAEHTQSQPKRLCLVMKSSAHCCRCVGAAPPALIIEQRVRQTTSVGVVRRGLVRFCRRLTSGSADQQQSSAAPQRLVRTARARGKGQLCCCSPAGHFRVSRASSSRRRRSSSSSTQPLYPCMQSPPHV
jgi:hypothetical protein